MVAPTSGRASGSIGGSIPNEAPGAAVACNKSIHIALYRYGAMGYRSDNDSDNAQNVQEALEKMTAKLPSTSCLNVSIDADNGARYAVRELRAGYLYCFAKRTSNTQNDGWQLDGFMAHDGSGLVDLGAQANETARLSTHKTRPDEGVVKGVSSIGICDPDDVLEFRLLYTPTELTVRQIQKIHSGKPEEDSGEYQSLRDCMQALNLSDIIADQGKSAMDDVIPLGQIGEYVAEMVAESITGWQEPVQFEEQWEHAIENKDYWQEPYRGVALKVLWAQYFTWDRSLSAYATDKLSNLKNLLSGDSSNPACGRLQGVAFVLADPIGITQELNHWRNEAWNKPQAYLEKRARGGRGFGITNEYRINVARMLEEVSKKHGIFDKYALISKEWKSYHEDRQSMVAFLENFEQEFSALQEQRNSQGNDDIGYQLGAVVSLIRRNGKAKSIAQELPGKWLAFDRAFLKQFPEVASSAQPQDNTQFQGMTEEEFVAQMQRMEQERQAKQDELDAVESTRFFELHGHRVQQDLYKTDQAHFKKLWDDAQGFADERAQAHISWLKSVELEDALMFYDRKEDVTVGVPSGTGFAAQMGFCIVGMNSTEEGQRTLANWIDNRDLESYTEIKNFLIRAATLNQMNLLNSLTDLSGFVGSTDKDFVLNETIVKTGLDLISLCGDYFSLLDELSHSQDQAGVGVIMGLINAFQTRAAGPNIKDRGLFKVMSSYMLGVNYKHLSNFLREEFARGHLADDMLYAAMVNPSRLSKPYEQAILEADRAKPTFRTYTLLSSKVALQGAILGLQLKIYMEKRDAVSCLNMFASFFATMSSITEISATLYERAFVRAATRSGAVVAAGKLGTALPPLFRSAHSRYFGACMGMMGGSLSMVADAITDGPKMIDLYLRGHWFLGSLHGVRFTASAYLLICAYDKMNSGAIGVLYAQLLDDSLSLAARRGMADAAARRIGATAVRRGIISRAGSALLGLATIPGANVIGFLAGAAVFVFPLFLDYAYEKIQNSTTLDEWLERSIYRKDFAFMSYDDMSEELSLLQTALLNKTNKVPVTLKEVEYAVEKQWMQESFAPLMQEVWKTVGAHEQELQELYEIILDAYRKEHLNSA